MDLAGEPDARAAAATAASVLLADGDDLSQLVVEDLAIAPLADRFLINHVRLDPT